MRKSVLLLEDDEDIRTAISDGLRHMEYLVITAEDGQRALEMLTRSRDEYHIDLIITDLLMPRVGGISFLEELGRRGYGVPILVITGYLDPEAREALTMLGHYMVLEKPFTLQVLFNKVEEILDIGNPGS